MIENILLWVALAILGATVSVPVTIILHDPVADWMTRMMARPRRGNISGAWIGTYSYDQDYRQPIQEEIEVTVLCGRVIGRVKGPATTAIRFRGRQREGRYITGEWFDPRDGSYYHGAFQFVVSENGRHIDGKWVGFGRSGKGNLIRSGDWNFARPAPGSS